MQQTDSRNEFLTPENMEMDTDFIQIDQVLHEIMQFLFLPLGGSSLLPKTKKLRPQLLYFINFFLTDAE